MRRRSAFPRSPSAHWKGRPTFSTSGTYRVSPAKPLSSGNRQRDRYFRIICAATGRDTLHLSGTQQARYAIDRLFWPWLSNLVLAKLVSSTAGDPHLRGKRSQYWLPQLVPARGPPFSLCVFSLCLPLATSSPAKNTPGVAGRVSLSPLAKTCA